MIVALASPRVATSLEVGLARVRRLAADAASRGAAIVCFPEAYLPGLHGVDDLEVLPYGPAEQERVIAAVRAGAAEHGIAIILGMARLTAGGTQIAALVVGRGGEVLGWQTKNQLAPSEDPFYVPGATRRVFEVDGVCFGVVICHEGWRYPETVRWAAARGARIVFHPQHSGSDTSGVRLTEWGSPAAPYYEKAMAMRSIENTIYFASVNYALRFPDSATSIIAPDGTCAAHLPYGEEGVLVHALDLEAATGMLARRFAPDRLREEGDAPQRS